MTHSQGLPTFPREGIAFLKQLKAHNDRDWFNERKADYKRLVEEPMKELVLAVSARCRKRGLPLHAKEKTPVFRVYRDIRFSNDKTPFKTHVGAEMRRSFSNSECLLYMHISPQECFVGAGVWQAGKDLLAAWRKSMIEDPARFQKMIAALGRHKLTLGEEHSLSAMPRGFQPYADKPIGKWLKLTSFITHRPLTMQEALSPEMVDTTVDFALHAKPLFEYAWTIEDKQNAGPKQL